MRIKVIFWIVAVKWGARFFSEKLKFAKQSNMFNVNTQFILFIYYDNMIATLRPDKKTHSSSGNVKKDLPGIARLVSGIVCMLCGKLAIQSANRRSLLP